MNIYYKKYKFLNYDYKYNKTEPRDILHLHESVEIYTFVGFLG